MQITVKLSANINDNEQLANLVKSLYPGQGPKPTAQTYIETNPVIIEYQRELKEHTEANSDDIADLLNLLIAHNLEMARIGQKLQGYLNEAF